MQPGHVGNVRWFINTVPVYNALNYLTTTMIKQAIDMINCIVYAWSVLVSRGQTTILQGLIACSISARKIGLG